MIDENFNNRLRWLGCKMISRGQNRLKVECNGDLWDVVFAPAQYVPAKKGFMMAGYGNCDCDQKIMTINRDVPVPVQKYVIVHELTHCLGYPEESEAHLRAIGLQREAIPYLVKEAGKKLAQKSITALEKAPEQLEQRMELETKKGATSVERFLESAVDDVQQQAEYVFGIDRGKPRRTLDEEWGTGVFGEEATERVVRRLSGLSKIFTPSW